MGIDVKEEDVAIEQPADSVRGPADLSVNADIISHQEFKAHQNAAEFLQALGFACGPTILSSAKELMAERSLDPSQIQMDRNSFLRRMIVVAGAEIVPRIRNPRTGHLNVDPVLIAETVQAKIEELFGLLRSGHQRQVKPVA